jgi:hypothetical protein
MDPTAVTLVCPAGYNKLSEGELDEPPKKWDMYVNDDNELVVVLEETPEPIVSLANAPYLCWRPSIPMHDSVVMAVDKNANPEIITPQAVNRASAPEPQTSAQKVRGQYNDALRAMYLLEVSLTEEGREDAAQCLWKIRDGLCSAIGQII